MEYKCEILVQKDSNIVGLYNQLLADTLDSLLSELTVYAINCFHEYVQLSWWKGTEFLHASNVDSNAIVLANKNFMKSVDKFEQHRAYQRA